MLRGGRRYLRELTAVVASVSVLDADPYMKTKYRQRAQILFGGEVDWRSAPTPKGQPLDDLLRHNIEVVRHSALLRRRWFPAHYGHGKSGHMGSLLQPCPV
jgi:hypothetical protein